MEKAVDLEKEEKVNSSSDPPVKFFMSILEYIKKHQESLWILLNIRTSDVWQEETLYLR